VGGGGGGGGGGGARGGGGGFTSTYTHTLRADCRKGVHMFASRHVCVNTYEYAHVGDKCTQTQAYTWTLAIHTLSCTECNVL